MAQISSELLLKIHERQIVNRKRRSLLQQAYRCDKKLYVLKNAFSALITWERQQAYQLFRADIAKLQRQSDRLHEESQSLHPKMKRLMKEIQKLSKDCDICFDWDKSWNIEQIRCKSNGEPLVKTKGAEFDKHIRTIQANEVLLGSMPAIAA